MIILPCLEFLVIEGYVFNMFWLFFIGGLIYLLVGNRR